MPERFDWSWLSQATTSPEVTLDVWLDWPEDVCRRIEVENGKVVYCKSAGSDHQAIELNLQIALRDAAKKADADSGQCHRVRAELDVLFTEVPFHYRKPDVVVFRCIPEDRAKNRWRNKPLVSDTLIAVEIVSQGSLIEDLRTKRALYADAGIPHYWIVRMAGDDGLAVSIERFVRSTYGSYVTEGVAQRDKDPYAVDTLNPFQIRITWDEIDADL